jgi:hypothetical protein
MSIKNLLGRYNLQTQAYNITWIHLKIKNV